MGYVTTATISGVSRVDGVTSRTVTMNRVGNVTNGFILRETDVDPLLAQKLTYRTVETRSPKGLLIRTMQSLWEWPYDLPTAPGVLAGVVTLNKSGLHVPSNCPANVRADIKAQIGKFASNVVGTVGEACFHNPVILGQPAF